jgi:hypothetical protein
MKNLLLRIGDWGLGIGDWGLGIGPNPHSPILFNFIYLNFLNRVCFKTFLNII